MKILASTTSMEFVRTNCRTPGMDSHIMLQAVTRKPLKANSGCDSIATLDLAVKSTLVSSTSIKICNNELPFNWNGQALSWSGHLQEDLKGKQWL
jgi:hypothetical protein